MPNKKTKYARTIKVEIRPKVVLRRLECGEKIEDGDYCFDARKYQPTRTGGHVFITENNHPHFRIEFEQ